MAEQASSKLPPREPGAAIDREVVADPNPGEGVPEYTAEDEVPTERAAQMIQY